MRYEPLGDVATETHGPNPRLRQYSLRRSSIMCPALNMNSQYGGPSSRILALSENVVKFPVQRSRVSAWPSMSGAVDEPATASVPTFTEPDPWPYQPPPEAPGQRSRTRAALHHMISRRSAMIHFATLYLRLGCLLHTPNSASQHENHLPVG